MNQAEAAHSLLLELQRLRSEGIRDVYVEEDSLLSMERVLQDKFGRPEPRESNASTRKTSSPRVSPSNRDRETEKEEGGEPAAAVIRAFPENDLSAIPDPPEFELPHGSKEERWRWLREKVEACLTCLAELNPNGKVVFGSGNLDADLFLCGEAPGAEEEQQGLPFVGPAGDLLTKIIEAMGLSRDSIYIGNIMNWRPRHGQAYGNRPPTEQEMNFCLPYLKAQIEIISPKVVVALGKPATDGLLGHDPHRRLGDCRGKWSEFEGTPLMVTYHPSYLLHNPSKASKRKVWDDMLLVMEKMEMTISEKQRGFFG
jgi:uracil-DNA glycosylase family 4